MRRDFPDRQALVDYLLEEFRGVVDDREVSPLRGGRKAALELLHQIDPKAYARSRNYLNGKVSRLSPYLRHGVLTLAEVRDHALSLALPHEAEKFINELGWRDYWQRLYRLLGKRIWSDLENYKTGSARGRYASDLPSDLETGNTGLACMDSFATQLRETGYLHNHARMWLAAYLIHWRKVTWQSGARWFLRHLLDGDPASNNLSWQWVASTFSHKPYFFNRENLERYTGGKFCGQCQLRNQCPLQGSYEQLESRLFPGKRVEPSATPKLQAVESKKPRPVQGQPSLFWMHGDGLRQASPGPALFVFDDVVLRHYRVSLKRLLFIYECLLELDVDIVRGSVVEQVRQRMAQLGLRQVVTTDSPSPGFARICQQLPVTLLPEKPFISEPPGGLDLTRFSRYWQKVQKSATGLA